MSESFLIAEIKTHSPFGYTANRSWDYLKEIAAQYGDMISVHVEQPWNGNPDLIGRTKNWSNKPILAKGKNEDDSVIRDLIARGADRVLVVGRLPAKDLLPYCFLEPQTLEELATYPENVTAVWNSRDLLTGGLKKKHLMMQEKYFLED